ncbi:UPF0725 protein [Raphanus sativus]|uniref:UPF0725 protein At2g20620-like n=1 Tax=Raphanus sativus TaxID=3726 RepID=A0A6J0MAM5_RAPSA|nr:UPF0725 protein At2g20620-like [Raphanus sativus]KAJ4873910.1 UPF0725 protein [Raphanus sativus]
MYDVMLDEAKLWLDERNVESSSSPPALPVKEDSGHDYEYDSAEDEMDPVEEAKYHQQVRDSDGFDVDFCYHPFGGIMPCGCNESDTVLAKLGLHCYNIDNGKKLQFRAVKKVNAEAVSFVNYYITLEAVDPDNNHSPVAFQTCVWDSATENKERLRLITKQCRIKPLGPAAGNTDAERRTSWLWDRDAVDEFYTCRMPNWLQDDELTGPNKLQFHEVKDSELQDSEWLNLYAEIALSSERPSYMETDLPLEVKKVVVRTKEDVEPSMKLKSSNAIFYMTFKAHRGPEWKAIIRQTRDGIQGHVCLEVTCMHVGKVV